MDPAWLSDGVPSGPSEEVLEAAEEEQAFYCMYLSMHVHIIDTCRDGDCGLDVMSVMRGLPRGLVSRQAIRGDLADFVHKHRENKALLHMLKGLGELTEHLGENDLDADAARLTDLTVQLHGDGALSLHHGDGEVPPVPYEPPQVETREYTEEEVSSIVWKCHLHKAGPILVANVIAKLPYPCIEAIVEEYRARGPAIDPPAAKPPRFILNRDMRTDLKNEATEFF